MGDTNNFPTEEEVRNSIAKLETHIWPEFEMGDNVENYIKQVTDLLKEEFKRLPNIIEKRKINDFKFRIFRVRDLDDFSNINLLCEHSYPPINLTTKLGRCNFPQHPVFYGSTDPMTAVAECLKNNNFKLKRYCISCWKIRESEEEVLILPYLFGQLDTDNSFAKYAEKISSKLSSVYNDKLTSDQELGIKLYLKFISDLFTDDKCYKKSAFFAHRNTYNSENTVAEIFIYPSIQTHYKGTNLAIHPNFVDRKMFVSRLYIFDVNSISKEDGKVTITISSCGTFIRNQIIWKNVTRNDTECKQFIQEDFKKNKEDIEFIEAPKH